MTIYNSQRVNNDPLPYTGPRGRAAINYGLGVQGYNPRPQYDNNPNPILEAFRTVSENPRGGLVALAERVLKNRHGIWDEKIIGRSHQEHAHRVLTKLINVYKETA